MLIPCTTSCAAHEEPLKPARLKLVFYYFGILSDRIDQIKPLQGMSDIHRMKEGVLTEGGVKDPDSKEVISLT